MTTRRTTHFLGAALLGAGLALALATAPAGALVNQLKDGSFEKPVVSGAVDVPAGGKIGTCANGAPYPGPDYHCWRVGSGIARIVHDDFLIGGVPVKPKAGAQFVALVGTAADPAGGYVPGAMQQTTTVAASTTPTLKLAYATMPVTGTASGMHLVVKACTANGLACVTDVDVILGSVSTGKPNKMGWKTFIAPIPVNADEGVVQVSLSSVFDPNTSGTSGDPAVDAVSLS